MKLLFFRCLVFSLVTCLITACASVNMKTATDIEPQASEPVIEAEAESQGANTVASEEKAQPPKPPVKDTTNADNYQRSVDTALEFCEASQVFWAEGNLDKAIDALDQAYTSILSVDTANNPKLIQQKEDLRFMISKRILEIYASRYTAVNGNHNEIPLIINEHVTKEIKRFQKHDRNFFIRSYKRSGRYRGAIVSSLKEAGLPEELSWLPLIESGFKTNALSSARALGLWQFIPSTGYKFGLKRDAWIDERLDPEKATVAAISYLTELHNIFGDWTTVLAAYNCGEGAVLRRIRSQKINYLDNFWDLYQKLPRETARYVPKFLATLHIIKDPARYGFSFEELDEPVPYEIVHIEKQVQLKAIANKLGSSFDEIIALNPELRYKATPPDTPYPLKAPLGTGEILLAKIDEIPKWTPPQRAYEYHRVKGGESLYLIALKYRTSVRAIAEANNIRRKHFIRKGQKLKIPLKDKKYAVSSYQLLDGGKYRVRRGDSLWVIAKRFNTTTKEIQRLNSLKSSCLSVGQLLQVVRQEDILDDKNRESYQVRSGDNLTDIAQKHNMSLNQLLQINSLNRRGVIYPGQTLLVLGTGMK